VVHGSLRPIKKFVVPALQRASHRHPTYLKPLFNYHCQ
jgi:hypothetical protein